MKVGWYPDPDDATSRRYWDGESWSEPLPASPRPKPSPPSPWAAPAMPTTDALAGGEPIYEQSAPAADDPAPVEPKKSRKGLLIVAAVIVVVLIAGGVVAFLTLRGGDDKPATFVARGSMTLTDFDGYTSTGGQGCAGDGGYDDLAEGASVTISDDGNETLALTRLAGGIVTDAGCAFAFVADVPAGRKVYGIEVTHRGIVRETEAEMRAGVSLTLG